MRGDLVQAAILGTSTGGAPAATDDPGDALATRLPGEPSAEARLLVAAGIAAVRSRAGFVPGDAPVPPIPSPGDAVAECPRRGSDVIVEVLDTGDVDLLIETAKRLREVKLRAPSLLLPDFLGAPQRAQGRRDEVIAAIRPVLGERGRWLAHLAGNQWAWGARTVEPVVHPADETTWKEGNVAERLAVLARRRGATPDVAREWVAAVWKEERADERAKFLETFAAGLSLADEAFLEAALDDRSAGVREVAVRLLAKLSGSAFARRAEERAASMLLWSPSFKPSIAQRLRGVDASAILDADPPAEVPKEWERDGLAGKPPQGVGERAFRLSQAVALVPPSRWSERFTSGAPELIASAAASEWRVALLLGLSRAAIAFADAEWALGLWNCWPVHDEIREGLLRAMDRDAAERAVASLFREATSAGFAYSFAVAGLPRPWSRPLAAAVLHAVRAGHMSRAAPPLSVAHNADALAELAPAFPLDALDETIEFASALALEGASARRRDALLHTLRLRQRIHQEITP